MLKKKIFYPLSSCIFLLAFGACKQDNNKISVSEKQSFIFLDSAKAAKVIVTDTSEHFFDRINAHEMAFQMGLTVPNFANRAEGVSRYKGFLETDVATFTPEEIQFLGEVVRDAAECSQKLSPKFLPTEVQLVKTHGKAYGGETFYTRHNAIFIPKQTLQQRNRVQMLETLLHELAHIFTRYHTAEKLALYQLIGFRPLQGGGLLLGDSLASRLITNPDGTNLGWFTTVTTTTGNIETLPLMYLAPDGSGNLRNSLFFFEYFEIERLPEGFNVITVPNSLRSTLKTSDLVPIFKEKYNTDYIIHPDEIVATNLALLALSYKMPETVTPLSTEGRDLLAKMKKVFL